MSKVDLNKEEFLGWLLHPATKALQAALQQWKVDLQEQWAAGVFTDLSQFGTAILNAKAIGNVEMIERVLALDYEQLEAEINDDQSQ